MFWKALGRSEPRRLEALDELRDGSAGRSVGTRGGAVAGRRSLRGGLQVRRGATVILGPVRGAGRGGVAVAAAGSLPLLGQDGDRWQGFGELKPERGRPGQVKVA